MTREEREQKARQETEERIQEGQEKRKRQIRKRILMAVLAGALTAGTITGIKIANAYDAAHVSIEEIEEDILTHSGHNHEPDGTPIDPNLGHRCPVVQYDGRFYEERLAETMEEHGFHEETIDAAEKKFALLYTDQVDEASEIDLAQIEQEAKDKHKTR